MLIGNQRPRPDLKQIRRIKAALRAALELSAEDIVTVTELTCLEAGCSPVETVVGLLRPGATQLQHKLHKATNAVGAVDLEQVCKAWGFDVQRVPFPPAEGTDQ